VRELGRVRKSICSRTVTETIGGISESKNTRKLRTIYMRRKAKFEKRGRGA